jgi:hypothetical protein
MDDEYLNNKSGEGRDIYDDDFEEDSNIDLSIEFENKLRSLDDDSELTIDDFLEEFGVNPDDMTGFAWASILKNAEKYKDMSDEEFRKEYDQYKNSITENNNSMRYLKSFKESYQGRWTESLKSEDVKQIYPMVKRILEIYPGESGDSEGIVDELERKLSSYDDIVREYIIDTLMFGDPDISFDELERKVIDLGDRIYDMGTERRMVIDAFEDAFEVIGKHFYLTEKRKLN